MLCFWNGVPRFQKIHSLFLYFDGFRSGFPPILYVGLIKYQYHFIGGPDTGLLHVLDNSDEPIEFFHHLTLQLFDTVKDDLCSLSKGVKAVLLEVLYHSIQHFAMGLAEPFGITAKT